MSIETLEKSIVPIISSSSDTQKANAFGTGFVFWKEGNDFYILTCAHVIEDIGKESICIKIDDEIKSAQLIGCGRRDYLDLAVLKVSGLLKEPLSISNMYGKDNIDFQISGCYRDGSSKDPIIGKEIEGETAKQITYANGMLDGWELNISENYKLQKGYSGSPVIDKNTKKVFAVATHAEGNSNGRAISIRHLLKIWDNAPNKLKYFLSDVIKERHDLSGIECHLLIGIKKSDNPNLYDIQAWIYPLGESIYVSSIDAEKIEDETINSHQFIPEILEELDKKIKVDHFKLTLEFILPIQLFSHHIEKWINEDDKPISSIYPITVRLQERLIRQKLQRFWKPIKPELDKAFNFFWLKEPDGDTLDCMIEDGLFCFGLQFDIYNKEQKFLSNILNSGVSVGLLLRSCADISCIDIKINEELFMKKSPELKESFNVDNLLLKELPRALLKLRKNQRRCKTCDYHISLFWAR